jgi:type I protein arginine methyltransferase
MPAGWFEAKGVRYKVAVGAPGVPSNVPSLWPSVGEYPIYDTFLYYCMTYDEARNRLYRSAIRRRAAGMVVLDIGTGADLNWVRECLGAGAVRASAVEVMPESFEKASALSRKLNLGDRLQLQRASSTELELPERVDLCVSEIIGTIGSSEGVTRSLCDARARLLKSEGGRMIPHRCITYVAPLELPQALRDTPTFSREAYPYLGKVFECAGGPLDVRLCVTNVDAGSLLSKPEVFEDLRFNEDSDPPGSRRISLVMERPGRLDGLLLWISLECEDGGEVVDALRDRCNWLPVFFPLFQPSSSVERGDTLRVVIDQRLSDDGWHPEYFASGALERVGAPAVPFDFASHYRGGPFRQNAYYEALFPR